MEELRQTFLADSISRLENLRNKINTETFSFELQREAFRTLHTIKGTAHTFGLRAAARLAHDLENLLAAAAQNKQIATADLQTLLPEGFEILIKALAGKHFRLSAELAEKFQKYSAKKDDPNIFDDYSFDLPETILAQMSKQEKANLRRALEDGNNLEILEIGFAPQTFAEEFKNYRDKISEKGEIIATFPSARFAAQNQIGFQLIFAAFENMTDLAGNHPVESGPGLYPAVSVNLPAIVAEMTEYGENLAASFGKKIIFETAVRGASLTPRSAKIIFDALLHLVRNAVDHGIERIGKIKIEIASDPGAHFLRVSDDGRGIDPAKLRQTAVEKNLIAADAQLSEPEILNLIFAHGFSTGAIVSEISGRGVGLDAVKNSVEMAGGEIFVKSAKGAGTTFEIFLKEK